MEWSNRVDYPEIGPGWVRLSKQRPPDRTGPKQVDHLYICPKTGTKFRSIKAAFEFIHNGSQIREDGRSAAAKAAKAVKAAPSSSSAGGGKAPRPPTLINPASVFSALRGPNDCSPEKKPEKKPKKQKTAAEIAKAEAAREAARQAKLASQHAAAAAAPAGAEVCFVCGSGDEQVGNEILLCDGVGCNAAYHLRCLERPLFGVPQGEWLCPECEQPAPAPAKLFSPHSDSKRPQPERQSVDGCDIMRYARAARRIAHPAELRGPTRAARAPCARARRVVP